MRFTRGFTLIELMVTIAVLAIVISIAAPSFSNILRDNRTLAMTNELQGAIQLARSEAVKRRSNVVICRRNAAGDDCDNSADWAAGWLILSGTTVIKVWDAVTGLAVAGPGTGLTFKSNGTVTAASNFAVNTPSCTGPQKRTLAVSVIGTTTQKKVDC
ncbi:GspH/FimT family pseudopilin [Pseudomonas sp. G34]|uniref:GspH/FimT family pseudopilin n=1 Tax=Pseudomonas sp. G34 TaxID=3059083 RepID=UPI00280900D4|nr:GspH/FimT family pseudopilin [Pseudomonas sp. G34]MDQ7983357.1 GspH/FimT family pseudopilin [Pseudomonas sp. G34]